MKTLKKATGKLSNRSSANLPNISESQKAHKALTKSRCADFLRGREELQSFQKYMPTNNQRKLVLTSVPSNMRTRLKRVALQAVADLPITNENLISLEICTCFT